MSDFFNPKAEFEVESFTEAPIAVGFLCTGLIKNRKVGFLFKYLNELHMAISDVTTFSAFKGRVVHALDRFCPVVILKYKNNQTVAAIVTYAVSSSSKPGFLLVNLFIPQDNLTLCRQIELRRKCIADAKKKDLTKPKRSGIF